MLAWYDKNASKFEHFNTIVKIEHGHFLHNFQCWNNAFVFITTQNIFEQFSTPLGGIP